MNNFQAHFQRIFENAKKKPIVYKLWLLIFVKCTFLELKYNFQGM